MAVYKVRADTHSTTPQPKNSCCTCGKQYWPQTCPAAEAVCNGCGCKSRRSFKDRYSASNIKCTLCNRCGHQGKCCIKINSKSSKNGGKQQPSASVIRSKSRRKVPCNRNHCKPHPKRKIIYTS